MRWLRGGTGVSTLFAGLVTTGGGLVILGLILTFTSLIHVRSILVTAAENGARVAAITGDASAAEQAVEDTLQASGLPLTYNGQTLWSASSTEVSADVSTPEAQVTVQYDAPFLFPDLLAAIGAPNSFPATIPMSVTASDVNEAYFTSS
ncbi:hypothetical protein [Alicyclobacillus fructus]|uniref:hypothetical protein n=1 Tax=Alicyclobacillus fructus TaxID=2816082 RepID=UPI001F2983C5|nr:hypothetical protein [Alicyclobacillus fructus]